MGGGVYVLEYHPKVFGPMGYYRDPLADEHCAGNVRAMGTIVAKVFL